jgi:hypothetical protein
VNANIGISVKVRIDAMGDQFGKIRGMSNKRYKPSISKRA